MTDSNEPKPPPVSQYQRRQNKAAAAKLAALQAPEPARIIPANFKNGRSKHKKLHPGWIPQILQWSVSMGYDEICDKIEAEHGVRVTPSAISRLINSVKVERSEVTQSIIRENIGGYILGDLECLKERKAELETLAQQHYKRSLSVSDAKEARAETHTFKELTEQIMRISSQLQDLAGVNEKPVPQTEADDAIRESIREKLEKFTRKHAS